MLRSIPLLFSRHTPLLVASVIGLLLVPRAADAYIGPGAGISVLGTVVAFLAAVLLAITGFVWYPIKRLLARAKGARPAEHNVSQP